MPEYAIAQSETTGRAMRTLPEGGVAASAVGGDDCQSAAVTPVTVGASGSPNVVTINGNSSTATLGACDTGSFVVWWEAFEINQCADVVIDFCGTTPIITPMFAAVANNCPAASTESGCPSYFSHNGFSRALCPGEGSTGNGTMFFDALPAGTYYYPIIANGSNPPGPYVMHVSAEACTGACLGCQGGCCNTNTLACVDGALQSNCNDVDERWFARSDCCAVECRAAGGPEYDAVDVELLSRVPLEDFTSPIQGNDVWGFQTAVGRKYAIMGFESGTGIIEITDPRNPVVVAQIPDTTSIWSDMKYYKGYAYNVNEDGDGVQIINLSDVDNGVATLVGSAPGGMQTAHNVAIDPVNGFLYPCGTNIAPGFIAFDLANPANPVPVGIYDEVYVHDLYIHSYEDCPLPARAGEHCELAYCFAGSTDFRIVDVTDKSAMTTVGTLVYPTRRYCHQGWISSDAKYIFSNDELDEANGTVSQTRTYVIDIQNVLAPTLAATFDHPGCWIDHNLMTRGDRVYNAHYAAGLRVLDVSNPLAPDEVAYFDTHPEDNVQDFVGVWGVYAGFPRVVLVSDRSRGLFTLCDEPDRPIPSFTVDTHTTPAGLPIAFDAASSTVCDPARSLAAYEWDFDYDGNTFTVDDAGSSVNHAYVTQGEYTAALRVTDDLGAAEIITLTITVGEGVPATSTWGLIVLSLSVLAAGAILLGRRSPSIAVR
jgi:choice-of-anchor B domain-containing protein